MALPFGGLSKNEAPSHGHVHGENHDASMSREHQRPRVQGVNTRWRCKGFNICRDGYEAPAIQYSYANSVPSGKHTNSLLLNMAHLELIYLLKMLMFNSFLYVYQRVHTPSPQGRL